MATATLPNPADYAETVLALTTAQEVVEAMTWRLREIVDVYDDECEKPEPTLEDVGALYSLADELDTLTSDLAVKRDQLQRILRTVNLARLEATDAV